MSLSLKPGLKRALSAAQDDLYTYEIRQARA